MSQINQIKNPCKACTHFKRIHPMVSYREGFKGLCLNDDSAMNIVADVDTCALFEPFVKKWVCDE